MSHHHVAILVRHADYAQKPNTPSAHQPYPLTDQGMEDAREGGKIIAAMMADLDLVSAPVIHCSSLLRAWQTAKLIEPAVPGYQKLISTDALNERGLGSVANLTTHEIEDVLKADERFEAPPSDWKRNSDYQLPFCGAESLMMAGERVAAYIRRIMTALPSSAPATAMIFVGHGAAFRHAAHCLGVLDLKEISTLSMTHARPVALGVPIEAFDPNVSWSHVAGAWKDRPKNDSKNDPTNNTEPLD